MDTLRPMYPFAGTLRCNWPEMGMLKDDDLPYLAKTRQRDDVFMWCKMLDCDCDEPHYDTIPIPRVMVEPYVPLVDEETLSFMEFRQAVGDRQWVIE